MSTVDCYDDAYCLGLTLYTKLVETFGMANYLMKY